MTKRSLQASPKGIHKAKQAFAVKGWTQENLAIEVNIKTRQPVWRFFTGKPVDRYIFIEICTVLDLDHREIADCAPAEFGDRHEEPLTLDLDIDVLVKQMRSLRFDKIQDQCGIVQMLDISHPVSLENVYIDVNILEEISSQQRLAIADLQNIETQEFREQFDKLGTGAIEQPQISGMRAVEKYHNLRVLGKPGAGKTTFLQHLAVQCNHSRFVGHLVPIFITLKNFVEESKVSQGFSLLKYIHREFESCGISNYSAIKTLLRAGRVLLLLDGMDEVLSQQSNAVLNEIRKFSEQYYKNRFVATCRMASPNLILRGFTDVEIAPFTQTQITSFAQKWFTAFTKTNELAHTKSVQFIQNLNEPSNYQFRRLASTPLFLHLACWIFYGQGNFPIKHSDFYKESLNVLLGKWDEARGVERDEVYRGFLLPQKLKLLSQIAAETFEKGQYFFTQDVIEHHIGNYLRQLPNTSIEPEEIEQQSLAVLKAIESQHGLLIERSHRVFSFSYLVFQEYLTARKIVTQHSLQPNQALEGLVSHIADPQWREVFLLTTTMLPNADELIQLMKQKINNMIKDWQFSAEQKQLLRCYYNAKQLLVDCLNSNGEVTAAVKCEMEASIFLHFQNDNSEIKQSLIKDVEPSPFKELAISAR